MENDIVFYAVLVGRVRLLTGLTLYARIGDLVAHVAIVLTLVALIGAMVTRRQSEDRRFQVE